MPVIRGGRDVGPCRWHRGCSLGKDRAYPLLRVWVLVPVGLSGIGPRPARPFVRGGMDSLGRVIALATRWVRCSPSPAIEARPQLLPEPGSAWST